ncbi:MAG: hypothetical protein GY792_29125 [Gammaproteobacteria bacterium]|nr:hypothetical protein [Gammaproteobacteria bacterium]
MQEPLQKVEFLPRPNQAEKYRIIPADVRSQRLVVFLLTFVISLAPGLYYIFQRPPVYISSASLLTVAPPDLDQQIAEADLQHVAIQLQRLLSKPLLDEVVRRLKDEDATNEFTNLSIYQLQSMLSVVPVPETNLVEVRAEEVRIVSAATTDSLREQYERLDKKTALKREELYRFRKDNEILSIGRDENQVLARLNGLTASLNIASEEEVKAKARLDAIRAAVKRGEAVVPDQDKRTLAQMEHRAQEMREQLAELETPGQGGGMGIPAQRTG